MDKLSAEEQRFTAVVVTVALTVITVFVFASFFALASIAGDCDRLADALERAYPESK